MFALRLESEPFSLVLGAGIEPARPLLATGF